VANFCIVEYIPCVIEQTDVEKAPKVVGEHLGVARGDWETLRLLWLQQRRCCDRLRLLFRPFQQRAHVYTLGVEVVTDHLAPEDSFVFAVIPREIFLGILGVERVLAGLCEREHFVRTLAASLVPVLAPISVTAAGGHREMVWASSSTSISIAIISISAFIV
jgi:hypothetical protein